MKHAFIDNSLTPHWSLMTPEKIEPEINEVLTEAQKKLDQIANQNKNQLTYNNTLLALESVNEMIENTWGKVTHLDTVSNSPALRKAYNTMLPIVSEFSTKIFLNPKLWDVLKTFSQTEETKKLSPVKKRFLEETLADFKESGADLSSTDKIQFEEIEKQLAQLTQKYSENVLDATNAWELIIDNEEDLAGLPITAKEAAREDAFSKNYGTPQSPKWRLTLHAPSFQPVMQYLDNDAIREKIWRANTNIGHTPPYDNTALIDTILKLRQQKAELLGYKDFADLILKRRMAKTGTNALHFIEDLHQRILNPFHEQFKHLEQYKAKKTNTLAEPLQPWEVSYWAEKQRKELFDFDEEELRPYFSVDQVLKGMFQIASKLFGIQINEKKNVDTWHPEVKYYEVKENNHLLGAFYTDWHPREPKRGGAWMNHLLTGAQNEPHLGLICGNMTKPTSQTPALLTHNEVETIFHEFGHLLHHLFGNIEVKSLHGTKVAWDFVELPSQILENWCWERESLNLFAKHYQTNEPIPEPLFQKMLKSRTYLSAIDTMRQLSIAKMDLELHIHYKDSHQPLDNFINNVLKDYLPKYKTTPPTLVRRLGHIFADPIGYAAGYYSYKWAEVLDADAFTRFKKEGILNPEIGIDFREKILSKGNSAAPEILFHNFMGREPKIDALLERSGLIQRSQ